MDGKDAKSVTNVVPQFIETHLLAEGDTELGEDELGRRLEEILGRTDECTWVVRVAAKTGDLLIQRVPTSGLEIDLTDRHQFAIRSERPALPSQCSGKRGERIEIERWPSPIEVLTRAE